MGHARALPVGTKSPPTDWDRLDRLSDFARDVRVRRDSSSSIAHQLVELGECRLGRLSSFDRYWLGTAWWAFHQPSEHLPYPDWAPDAASQPDLALQHPEGGNCESSASFQAALLSEMGVPTVTVYGHYLPSGEGHVWAISDVDGAPMLSDVHVARAPADVRGGENPWRPSASQVQTAPSGRALVAFLRKHRPNVPELTGISSL